MLDKLLLSANGVGKKGKTGTTIQLREKKHRKLADTLLLNQVALRTGVTAA